MLIVVPLGTDVGRLKVVLLEVGGGDTVEGGDTVTVVKLSGCGEEFWLKYQ
ncbi:conserved protein of unknown function [Limnospira indica PCC 8005]|uniref:Uncharacterized protein n=1 Tax=Limnospira indica PCC 8005 TaxID=376219 RepID=A0A9P1KAP5_9CYAN|nr:conserved protein of unknown function [Limnospira indica PCC 8005]